MTDFKTSDRDVNRAIRSWLREDRHEDVSRVAGAVLDQVDTIPQRRSTWWPARRTPTMNKFLAIGLGAAAVVVVALIGVQLIGSPGTNGIGGPVTNSSPEPATAEPTPSQSARRGPRRPSRLHGQLALGGRAVPPLTVDHPGPWLVRGSRRRILLKNANGGPPDGAVRDRGVGPCRSTHPERPVPLGDAPCPTRPPPPSMRSWPRWDPGVAQCLEPRRTSPWAGMPGSRSPSRCPMARRALQPRL